MRVIAWRCAVLSAVCGALGAALEGLPLVWLGLALAVVAIAAYAAAWGRA
ncbi:hypothetical protein [Paracidovorax avenae]|nr:hypothetical protein [Paracidovorax avenae]